MKFIVIMNLKVAVTIDADDQDEAQFNAEDLASRVYRDDALSELAGADDFDDGRAEVRDVEVEHCGPQTAGVDETAHFRSEG